MAKTPPQTSTVTLTGIVRWTGARHDPPPAVTLENVPFPAGVEPPRKGLSLYYGSKTAQRELADAYQLAERAGQHMTRVQVKVSAGRPKVPVSVRWEEIPHLGLVHLGRLHSDAMKHLREIWEDVMETAGLDTGGLARRDWTRFTPITRHPHLIYNLWRREPFRQLDVIIYPVEGAWGGLAYRGTLFRARAVREIVPGLPGMEVRLPSSQLSRSRG